MPHRSVVDSPKGPVNFGYAKLHRNIPARTPASWCTITVGITRLVIGLQDRQSAGGIAANELLHHPVLESFSQMGWCDPVRRRKVRNRASHLSVSET